MRRQTIAVFCGLILAGSPVFAAEPAPTARESVLTFFKHLKLALAGSAVRGNRKASSLVSVAAVRGKDQSNSAADPDTVSVKGDAASKRLKREAVEDAEFEKAVDLILKGKVEDGIKSLLAFKTAHPKSRNQAQVSDALARARALLEEEASAATSKP